LTRTISGDDVRSSSRPSRSARPGFANRGGRARDVNQSRGHDVTTTASRRCRSTNAWPSTPPASAAGDPTRDRGAPAVRSGGRLCRIDLRDLRDRLGPHLRIAIVAGDAERTVESPRLGPAL